MIYLLRVATVPTACGIETLSQRSSWFPRICELQQYLPLAVLKQKYCLSDVLYRDSCNSTYRLRYWNPKRSYTPSHDQFVATVPTACGIETMQLSAIFSIALSCNSTYRLRYWNAAFFIPRDMYGFIMVATVPTACGIETYHDFETGREGEYIVATVPTACGIETSESSPS